MLTTITKPFFSKTNWNKYEIIKTILMCISGISIIRFILFFIFFGLLLLCLNITHLFYSFYDVNGNIKSFSKFRRFICYFPQIISRICLFVLGYYYINETFDDKDYKLNNYFNYYEGDTKPKIVIYNHISFLDSLYFLSKGQFNILVTAGLLDIHIIGKVLKNIGTIFVARNKEEKTIFPNPNKVIELIVKNKNPTKPILLAPEGTTHQNDYLFNFQLGAFRPLVPIRPVILDFKFKHIDPSWTYSCSPIYTLFMLCCQFINHLDVKNLKVQNPYDNEKPEDFRDRVKQIYLESNPKLIKVDLSVLDSHYFNKLYNKNPNIAIYIYENIIKKSISNYSSEEKIELEKQIDLYSNKKNN